MKTNIKTQKENIVVDWTKHPQLVISDSGTIIMTSLQQPDEALIFSGICVDAKGDNKSGEYSSRWSKAFFSPFEGSIELSND